MIGHYLTSALAKLLKTPCPTAANVLTLASGLACFVAVCAVAPALAQPALAEQDGGGPTVAAATADGDGANESAIVATGRDVVVVTGRSGSSTRREAFEQARELSRVDRSRLYDEALPRFAAPLCPGVAGLKPKFAELIVARILDNAGRIGVDLAGAECSPNLIVVFIDDGRMILGGLERDRPERFGLIPAAERDELLNGEGPVRVWSNIEPLYSDGTPLPRYRGRIEMPDRWGQLNRMFLPTRTDIRSALILFDREAAAGMTTVQLADYATMRGLAHLRPASGGEAMATILALFEDGGRDIAGLTGFDISYLRSLYYHRPDLPAVTKLLGVGRRAASAEEDASEMCAQAETLSSQPDLC